MLKRKDQLEHDDAPSQVSKKQNTCDDSTTLVRSRAHDDEEIINELDIDNKECLADEDNPLHVATSGSGHFIGIQPEGNLFFATNSNCRNPGLGKLARFEDSFLLENFFTFFSGVELARMASVSKSFYAFIYGCDVDLWRDRTLEMTNGDFTFQWYWRVTYAVEYQRRNLVPHPTIPLNYCYPQIESGNDTALDYTAIYPTKASADPAVKLTDFYSDSLFQPWFCADSIIANSAAWDCEYNIERVDARTLTVEQFRERYELPGKPVVLTGLVEEWPAMKEGRWSVDALTSTPHCLKQGYTCGVVDIPLDKYFIYARRVSQEESPLYLFDKRFGEKTPELLRDFEMPEFLREDFYSYLQTHPRPSFRWWLIGPPKSGSSFHKDPLYTHAWNGLISGKKKWILYPPHICPPGIYASADHLQVAAPISVAEWYLNYYHQTQVPLSRARNKPAEGYDHVRDYPIRCDSFRTYRPVEIVQGPGDMVFIPSQWWHSAINLEAEPQATGSNSPAFNGAIAVTANSIHKGNFLDGLKFLTKIGQDALRQDLEEGVERQYPGLKLQLEEERRRKVEERVRVAGANACLHGDVSEGVVQSAVSVVRKDLAKCFGSHNTNAHTERSCAEPSRADASTDDKQADAGADAGAGAGFGGFSFAFNFGGDAK